MDNLPDHLTIEILSRLNDSTQLARCRCVSKTLNTLARKVRSIHLCCSLYRFIKMRSPETSSKVTPFKTIFYKLISEAQVPIESVSLDVGEGFGDFDDKFEDKSDDLFLADGPFSVGWMTDIGYGLKSISISNFWYQSYTRETNILEVLSHNCHNLVELTLKTADLCVDDMHPMPLITRLTLDDVKISEMHLNKLMECLPCLQFLLLVAIRDEHPKIHHLNLRELKATVFDSEGNLSFDSLTIFAPNLTKLELQSDYLRTFSLHAPLLSYFHLALNSAKGTNVEKFKTDLKKLNLVSPCMHEILSTFPGSKTVQDLTLDSLEVYDPLSLDQMVKFSDVFTVFPNVTSLTLGYEFWMKQMFYSSEPVTRAADNWRGLKQITVYLVLSDIVKDLNFILYVMRICSNLTDIVLFIPSHVNLSVASSFVSLCKSLCPKVRWRWRTWKWGINCCISNSSVGAANIV